MRDVVDDTYRHTPLFGLQDPLTLPLPVSVSSAQVVAHRAWDAAYSRILAGVEAARPTILLVGGPGNGKTLLLQRLAHTLRDAGYDALSIPRGDLVAEATGAYADRPPDRPLVVLIDEADRAGTNVPSALRPLKPRTLILAGLPGLAFEFADAEARAEAVALGPVASDEIATFLAARLGAAGLGEDTFGRDAIAALAELSHGTPRLLNALAASALFLSRLGGVKRVEALHVIEAAALRDGRELGELPKPGLTDPGAVGPVLSALPGGEHRGHEAAHVPRASEAAGMPAGETPAPRRFPHLLWSRSGRTRLVAAAGAASLAAGLVLATFQGAPPHSVAPPSVHLISPEPTLTAAPPPHATPLAAAEMLSMQPAPDEPRNAGLAPTGPDRRNGSAGFTASEPESAPLGVPSRIIDILLPGPPSPSASPEAVAPVQAAELVEMLQPERVLPGSPLPLVVAADVTPPGREVQPLDRAAAVAGAAPLQGDTRARVTLLYPASDPDAEARAAGIVAGLRSAGVAAVTPIAVAARLGQSGVRYFFLEDRPAAAAVSRATGLPVAEGQVGDGPTPGELTRPGTIHVVIVAQSKQVERQRGGGAARAAAQSTRGGFNGSP